MVVEDLLSTDKKHNKNLAIYLDEISKYKQLSMKEEDELIRRVSLGDNEAKEKLFNSLLFYVAKRASFFVGYGMDYLDLIQEGNIVLYNAICKFEPRGGILFRQFLSRSLYGKLFQFFDGDQNRNISGFYRNVNWLNIYKRIEEEQLDVEDKRALFSIALEFTDKESVAKAIANYAYDTLSLDDMGIDVVDQQMLEQNDHSVEDAVIRNKVLADLKDIFFKTDITDKQKDIIASYLGLYGEDPVTFMDIARAEGKNRVTAISTSYRLGIRGINNSPYMLEIVQLLADYFITKEEALDYVQRYQERMSHINSSVRSFICRGANLKEVYTAVNDLDDDEKKIFYKFCNGDINNEINPNLTPEEASVLYIDVIPRLQSAVLETRANARVKKRGDGSC